MPASAMATNDQKPCGISAPKSVTDRAEGSRRERAADDHDELARCGEHGVHEHQQEDGVDAVVADERRQRARKAREEHSGRDYRRAVNGAYRSTRPTLFVAETCSLYEPPYARPPEAPRPFHCSRCAPAAADRRERTRTTMPFAVSIVAVTFAARASLNDADEARALLAQLERLGLHRRATRACC